MKRLFLVLVLVLAFAQIAQAQEPDKVYLPVIFSGDCTMTTGILAVSDGTTTIDLHNLSVGIGLKEWNPTVTPHETTSQQSPLADMKRPVSRRFAVATETFTFTIKNITEDQLYVQIQELERLLEKAANYWTTDVQPNPVYLVVRGNCETNTRYAIIYDYSFPQLDDPMSPDFTTIDGKIFDDLTLNIERGHWLANAPGTGECSQTNNTQTWDYDLSLQTLTTDPVGEVRALIQLYTGVNDGFIYAGDNGQIWYSDDDGATWNVETTDPTGVINVMMQHSGGTVLAADTEIWFSETSGTGAWNSGVVFAAESLLETTTGKVLAGGPGEIKYCVPPNFNIWNTATADPTGRITTMIQLSTGRILAAELNAVGWSKIYYSDDDGVTWAILPGITAPGPVQFLITDTGRILLTTQSSGLFFSDDNGTTWGNVATTGIVLGDLVQTNILASTGHNRIISTGYGAANYVFYSDNDGLSWAALTNTAGTRFSPIQITTGDVLIGSDGEIQVLNYSLSTTMGRPNTCNDEVFIVNHNRAANLTHIFVDDGGVFGANLLPMTVFPVTLLPAVPVVNDAIYFGIDTTVFNSGPFDGIVFDLASGIIATDTFTVTWEVWTGAAWVALTVHDETIASGTLQNLGVNSIHWVRPTGWATTAVNGVTGYWVRARLSALVGAITPPTQQNRNIYAPTFPYVEVDAAQVAGDIAAIAEVKAHNRSDQDGPGGSGPDLYDNRLIMGLRSTERGSAFSAYLNVSNEQNPFGVTVTAGTTTTIDADVSAPTGWRGTFAPAGAEAMLTRITFTLGPTIARDYYGTYHAFVRANRTAGAATDLGIRLQISAGSGGVIYTTETKYLQTTTIFELLDFGQVSIPPAGVLKTTELGDSTEIRIQASSASGTPDLRLYDLILIPVDEYAIDAVDKANETDSDVGRSGSKDKYLNLDSLTNPKENIRALVQIFGSNFVTSIYGPIAPGELFLQANKEQRLWFLAAKTSATGTAFYWIAPPEISHSIQVLKNERYLSVRGNR